MNNIYIIRIYNSNISYIKLGYSKNIFKRLDSYYAHNPLTEVIGTAYIENGLEFEQDLHNKIDSVVRKEWYNEDKLDIILNMINQVGGVFTTGEPIKPIKPIKVTVSYTHMVKTYLKTKDISSLDRYKYKTDYYNLIMDSLRLYGKVDLHYSRAKAAVDNYGNDEQLLINDLQSTFKVNSLYTVPEIKDLLTKIYSKYSINRTPKATDLNEFFETQQVYPNRVRHTKIVSTIN